MRLTLGLPYRSDHELIEDFVHSTPLLCVCPVLMTGGEYKELGVLALKLSFAESLPAI